MNALTREFDPLSLLAQDNAVSQDILRNAVAEIIGSYHHPFDVLLEAIQNAVDACQIQFVRTPDDYEPEVHVILNLSDNTVECSDNGTGISSSEIRTYFFTPFSSQKRGADEAEAKGSRGNKGVGATFLSYGSKRFEIWSYDARTGEQSGAAMFDAASWLSGDGTSSPLVFPSGVQLCEALGPHGTTIRFQLDPDLSRLGRLREHGANAQQWAALLRLFTAIGYIDLEDDEPFLRRLRSRVTVVDNELRDSQIVDGGFFYPDKLTPSHVQMSQLAYSGPRNELDARQRDKDVLFEVYSTSQVAQVINDVVEAPYYRDVKRHMMRRILSNHRPRAYVAFVYSVEFWESQNDRIWGEHSEQYLTHGYLYATKHQRIGEQSRLTLTGRTGDFNRFYMVLELDGLSADIGRKSLGQEYETFANELLRGVRNAFFTHRGALKPSPNVFTEEDDATLEDVANSALHRPTLSLNGAHLVRVPDSEQDVVALFFDLLGSNVLRGYQIYSTHTAQTYDGVGMFELPAATENYYDSAENRLGIPRDRFSNGMKRSPSRAFFEFKLSSDGLIRDLESGAKRLSDIKWLICWDIGRRHVSYGAAIHEVLDPAHINQREYYGVTHILTEGADKVFVICLKTVVEYLNPNAVSS